MGGHLIGGQKLNTLCIGIFLKIKDCERRVVRHSGKYRNSYPKFTYWE
jgi:hypothetical protein